MADPYKHAALAFDQRQDFERWASQFYVGSDLSRCSKHPGKYADPKLQFVWEAWRAALRRE